MNKTGQKHSRALECGMFDLGIDPVSNAFARTAREILVRRYGIQPNCPVSLSHTKLPYLDGVHQVQCGPGPDVENGILVGALRIGSAPLRMAQSICSFGRHARTAYLMEMLSLDSPEAKLIREADDVASFFSRLAAEWGGPLEWLWNVVSKNVDANSLHFSVLLAEALRNLLRGADSSQPFISAHPLAGQIAVAVGFSRVINLVPHAFPQYYLLVPGATNLVQNQTLFDAYVQMGIPPESLAVAGHWVSDQLSENINADAQLRIARADSTQRLRVLFVIESNSDRNFLVDLIRHMHAILRDDKLRLLVITTPAMQAVVQRSLERHGVEFACVESFDAGHAFVQANPLNGSDLKFPVTFFTSSDQLELAFLTDCLIRISDILITQPSDLAFLPVPKILTRRATESQANSSQQAETLGDAWPEQKTAAQAAALIRKIMQERNLLTTINERIVRNAGDRVYEGSKLAVELAESWT
ncbi:MAG: hypothetical protein K8S54_21410 [Spirochaetia bacterium]|nr:hypothetical protein [Spirochaetia bacterium]